MDFRLIEIYTEASAEDKLKEAIKDKKPTGYWYQSNDDLVHFSVLVTTTKAQELMDCLQDNIPEKEMSRVVVLPVEAVLPEPDEEEEEQKENENKKEENSHSIPREELYNDVTKGIKCDQNFILLVIFSTLVAAIGLIENNVAVIIGAMVIAPLLGPNLALALATTLGDKKLIFRSMITNIVGLSITIAIAILIGLYWQQGLDSEELMLRTDVGYDEIILALASGAAAVFSLTTGLPSVLVGVMVAVALLPPAVTMGIMFGAGNEPLALGAMILLIVNIVCVNLSAKLAFMYNDIRPRTWHEKKDASQSTTVSIISLVVTLAALMVVIFYKQELGL